MPPMVSFIFIRACHTLNVAVTEEVPREHRPVGPKHTVHKVQPLRKDDMQTSCAQDLGVDSVTHGFYGSMKQSLGSCVGFCGAIPCCPFPNPFKEVRQGLSLHPILTRSFFFKIIPHVYRFCGTGLPLRPVLQGRRPRFGPGQCLHGVTPHRGRQNPDYLHRAAVRHHSRQRQRRNVRSSHHRPWDYLVWLTRQPPPATP